MKNPFRSSFLLSHPLSAIICLSFAGHASLLAQTNGTWTLDGPGAWSNAANWASSTVASGAGAIADFSTLDITGDHLVTLDADFTIGTLVAQDATTPSHNWTLGGTSTLTLDNGASQPVLNVINQTLAISAPLVGTNGFSKTGGGILDLSGVCAYSGTTTLANGTLKSSGGDDRLPTGTTLAFTGTTGTLDLTTTTQTLAGITVPNGLAATYTINGNSLTLAGAADRQFGPGGTTANPVIPAHSITANFAGLSSFTSTAPANIFRVGLKTGAQNSGVLTNVATVTLADQNAITANILAIGDVGANNTGGTSTLRLGRLNTLNVGTINAGASGRSNTNLIFDPSRIDPSVKIRHTDGTSAVTDWRVGQVANFSASTWTDVVNLSTGTLDALVTNLTVGTADIQSQTGRGGTENASFTMGAGTLETSTLLLGRISSTASATITSAMAGNGTFTLNHPAGILKATTVTLAENTVLAGGAAARSVSGTFNVTAGTLEATTIQRGAQTGNATVTTAVNWTDGTIRNLTPTGLTINGLPLNLLTGSHVFDATGSAVITANSASTFSGIGGLTKTGTGTLSLQGTNTYTGPTNVQAGTLAISNSFPNGSTFTVDAAATLELANVTVIGNPALDIDGSLKLTGPVRVGGPLTAVPGTLTNVLQYGSITGEANLSHNYRSASFTIKATATDLSVAEGTSLIWTGAAGPTWDFNNTVSWKDTSNNPEKFYWADSVTFDSAGSAFPDVSLAAEMQPVSVTVNESTVDYVLSGPGFISGTTGLTKNGTAKLTIAANNTNTGTTTIHAGTLEIGNGGTTGSVGSGAIVNHSALVFNRSNNATVANAISGMGSLTKLGAGATTLTADNTYSGVTTISAGALHVGQQTTTGSLGTSAIENNSTLRLNRADGTNPYAYTFANDISGTGTLIVGQNLAGASAFDSVVTLTGNNTFTGNISVLSGGLKILNATALGPSPKTVILTNGTNGRPQFFLDGSGGNITVPAGINFDTSSNDANRPSISNLAGDNVIEGNFTLKSGGGDTQIRVLGGSLTLNGQFSTNTTLRNLRLSGNPGANGTINGKLTNGSNPWNLFVVGSNTWTLTNIANDFTGNTTVSSGTLLANNASGSATGTGNITVNTTGTFGGTGIVSGSVTVDAGGTLAPGANGIESLETGAVSLNDSSTLAIDIHTGSATNDQLVVTGDVNLTGTVNLALNDLGANAPLPAGTKLVLVDYSGVWDDTDIVHFNGNPVPNGSTISYGANTFTVDYSDDSGSLGGTAMTLTATVAGDPYTAWADSFSLVGANRAPTADPDNDGLDNGIEFVIGAKPNTFTVPAERPTSTVTGGNLVFTFKRSDASEAFSVFVEHGTTLATWPDQILIPVVPTVGPPVSVTDNGPSALDDVTVVIPMGTDPRKFARLRADIPYTP